MEHMLYRRWRNGGGGVVHDVLKHDAGRGGIASILAVPSPRAWRESSEPVNKFTIDDSHGVSFTPCILGYPTLACARADARGAAVAHHLRAARCKSVFPCAATVRPERGWGGRREGRADAATGDMLRE